MRGCRGALVTADRWTKPRAAGKAARLCMCGYITGEEYVGSILACGPLYDVRWFDKTTEDALLGTVDIFGVPHHVTFVRVTRGFAGCQLGTRDPHGRMSLILDSDGEGKAGETVEIPGFPGTWICGVDPFRRRPLSSMGQTTRRSGSRAMKSNGHRGSSKPRPSPTHVSRPGCGDDGLHVQGPGHALPDREHAGRRLRRDPAVGQIAPVAAHMLIDADDVEDSEVLS